MATIHEMGEVNETDSNEETMTVGASINGDISCDDGDTRETQNSTEHLNCDDDNSVPAENLDSCEDIESDEKMDVDEINSEDDCDEIQEIDNSEEEEEMDDENVQNGLDTPDDTQTNTINDDPEHSNEHSIVINDSAEEIVELEDKDAENVLDKDDVERVDDNNDLIEVIDDNRDPIEVFDDKGFSDNGSVNDSGDDVMISESVDNDEVINLEDDIGDSESRRRSCRNVGKLKKQYSEDEVISNNLDDSEESDIEEVLPEDPLAVADDHSVSSTLHRMERKKTRISSSTIVVKDTKCLAEIASKSTSNSNSKKEPTLVIIDTNSILSGRGPVPIAQKSTTSTTISNSHPIMPMALPAQGVYPANMRATITPIPMTTSATTKTSQQTPSAPLAPVLPTLSDDMFVVEAPSFIVPYVYEKPPIKDLQQFIKDLSSEIAEQKSKDNKNNSKESGGGSDKLKKGAGDEQKDKNELDAKNETDKDSDDDEDKSNIDDILTKKSSSYFDGPLGKFFMGIGLGLVEEMVQADLLRQQKRKREREGNQNPETTKTINSLIKNLEFSKENNEPYHMTTKKCEFCTFKTESSLVMSYHLETPHMKNFIYRCNFCSYEVRSPHDILVHIEVLHGIRGRLERAPCYHQCPNCPFEDNQKGKLSRHLVSCARKFKPERNLEPLADFEPPAKIPRAPRMKQQSLGNAAAVYQAMARNPQFQMMSKMSNNMSALQRNRGRPTLGTSIKPSNIRPATNIMYNKTGSMSGGSVLVPTNYQFSGNQLYQVVGGQEIGGCLYPGGATAFAPSICANPNSVTFQNQGNKSKNSQQPSISITPLPRGSTTSGVAITKMGDSNSKTSFVICEICDGYIKDLEQLRNHMQWIHKVKIHPKMINNRPPLNCQKCQFRFFTDQGLERHLLGSHGLVTSSMQEAANKSKDAGRCPVCGRVYQWKLLNHVARDHNMTLKPAHLSYKCTVCTATFGMYKQFESHVYSAHSVVAKRVMDKKGTSTSSSSASSKNESVLKPLKINDEITIIPQPSSSKPTNGTGSSKEGSPSITAIRSGYSNGTPTTSKILGDGTSSCLPRFDRFSTASDIAK